MIADRLRAAILQAAISGKLTDQRPEDGTATELLEQIAAERAALVKAGKLKKRKPLPPITDEDRPFPIPSNWVWARFGEAARYAQRGKSPTYADVSPYLAVSQKCVRWTGIRPCAGTSVCVRGVRCASTGSDSECGRHSLEFNRHRHSRSVNRPARVR